MKNIYMCLVVALLQFSLLEAERSTSYLRNPDTNRQNPIKPHILINRPSPTIPEHEIRFRREASDNFRVLPEIGRPRPGKDILIYRPTPTFPVNPKPELRFRRDVGDDVIEELHREKRQFAPGGKYPNTGSSQQGGRGTWDVSVNKNKGHGPQVRTEAQGNIYTSPKGNVRVDGHGHHEFGKGRKPDYGVGVKVEGRWRREVTDVADEEIADEVPETEVSRTKRSFAPGGGFPNPGSSQQGGRGSWDVSVNKNKGRGPQVRTEAQGNVYTSPKGNVRVDAHGHHEFGKGRKPDYGGGVKVGGRWRREAINDAEEEQVDDVSEIDVSRTKRFTQGGTNFPSSSGGQQQGRGTWDVSVNKDKGRGPQVRTEGQGNIYTSPSGNVRVDGHGHHEFGKGRKPDYGGGVTVHGKWKREAIEESEVEQAEIDLPRSKRFAPGGTNFPSPSGGQQQGRGTWDVSVNKDKGRGPQVRTEGQGNIYTSPSGNVRVDGHGHHEFGKGRKPDYGGGVTVHGKWKREAIEESEVEPTEAEIDLPRTKRFAPGGTNFPSSSGGQQQGRGTWDVSVNKDKGRGPQVRTEGQGNIYTSPSGNVRVDGHGHHEFGKGRKPDYGGGVTVHGKWKREAGDIEDADKVSESERVRREANPQERDRGSVTVNVERGPTGHPQVRTDATANIYTSPKGNWQVNGNGYHQAGHGQKPSYGAGVSVTGRFRREADEMAEEEQKRERREANPQKDRGSVNVNVERGPTGHPQVRTDATANIYTSPNGNWQVNGNGYHQAGHGQKPSYGAGVSVTGRFRREASSDEMSDEEYTRERREANPQKDRGSVNVNVNRGPTGHPSFRTDANANIYTSPNGNFKLNGNGYHQFGHGQKPTYGGGVQADYNMYRSRNGQWEVNGNAFGNAAHHQKPNYGGGVSVIGRFRRDTDEADHVEVEEVREKREANPQKDRGSVNVNVNRGPTGHPSFRTDANANIYTSPNGNFKLNGNGYHQFGHGQKPTYGGGVQADYNMYKSRNGHWEVNGNAYGNAGRHQKPNYGGGVSVIGRFRRDTEDDVEVEEEVRDKREANPQRDRGSVGVTLQQGARGPQVRTDASYNIYRSPNRNWELNSNAFHEAGRHQKPNYGAGVTLTGRFRRDAEDNEEASS